MIERVLSIAQNAIPDYISSTTGLLSILCIATSTWYILWKRTRYRQLIDKVPGFKDWPIVGDILHIEKDPVAFLEQWEGIMNKRRHDGIVKLKILELPWFYIFSAESHEKLLSSSTNITKNYEYYILHSWLGLSLLTSTGERWKRKRRMLTPAFHFSILQDFYALISSHARDLKEKLLRDACDTGKPFNIFEDITMSTLDIICDTAMGVHIHALDGEAKDYIEALYIIKDGTEERPRVPFNEYDLIYNLKPEGRKVNKAIALAHEFTLKVIKERREAKEAGGDAENKSGKHKPFLDLLLDCRGEDGNPLPDSEIREEVDTFMFEGHDTTSSAIGFTVYLLGKNIDAQRKCQEEIDKIIEDPTRDFTSADLSKMSYLERCIKEAMRIFPPVPYFGRGLEEETEFGGYTIPKGVAVTMFLPALHTDPQVFPDPMKFDPDRFTKENCAKRSPFAYVPFSAGPRNCIGQRFAMMELKIIMATLLMNFNIESVQTVKEMRIRASLILQPLNGVKVKLTSRA